MKRIATILVVLAMAMMMSAAAFADGAAIYGKCKGCHGPAGEGKIGPKIAGTDAAKVTDVLTNGGQEKAPHKTAFKGLSADDIAAVSAYVAGL
jgi:cytochrome c553